MGESGVWKILRPLVAGRSPVLVPGCHVRLFQSSSVLVIESRLRSEKVVLVGLVKILL
jgi:hypothetical protein